MSKNEKKDGDKYQNRYTTKINIKKPLLCYSCFFWMVFLSGDEDSDYSNEDPKDNALS